MVHQGHLSPGTVNEVTHDGAVQARHCKVSTVQFQMYFKLVCILLRLLNDKTIPPCDNITTQYNFGIFEIGAVVFMGGIDKSCSFNTLNITIAKEEK